MKSLDTALQILSLFKDEERPLGVVDVAERLDLGKSHASRVLATMREAGYLKQHSDTRKYSVGIEAFAVGARFINDNPMTRSALPLMRACSEKTGHSVFISVRHGSICRHVLAYEGRHFADTQWRMGIKLALHATASGKLLLALLPEDEREALIRQSCLTRYTARTITDRDRLRDELGRVQATGWSEARGESVNGLAACAVPIYGQAENLVAAFGIVAPAVLLPKEELPEIIVALRASAERLSLSLGARGYPY